jgi:hypothetical protein
VAVLPTVDRKALVTPSVLIDWDRRCESIQWARWLRFMFRGSFDYRHVGPSSSVGRIFPVKIHRSTFIPVPN